MSSRTARRLKAKPKKSAKTQPTPSSVSEALTPRSQIRKLWAMRLGMLLLSPILALLLTEAALRLFGYGEAVSFFIRSKVGDELVTNDKFARQFFDRNTVLKPFLFTIAKKKPPGTVRICILGESAAMGTPDPAFGFGRILEAMLGREYPNIHFEVMNAAMRGINSHVIRLIARECAKYDVDVFMIYMGNNEIVGMHGPNPGTPPWVQSLALIKLGHWVRTTKVGQLLSNGLNPKPERHPQDMTYFHNHRLRADDERLEKTRKNFQMNLEEILASTTASGAKAILSTVAVNLKDFPPLASLHRADLSPQQQKEWESAYESGADLEVRGQYQSALEQYLTSAHLDDHYAELHFRMARCYSALLDWPHAKEHFALARDWDSMQFRTDGRMNQIIHQVAAAHSQKGVTLLDSEKAFTASDLSEHELPGERLFYEHVHPTFAGNHLLAQCFYKALASVLNESLPKKSLEDIPTAQQCADDIAYTLYDDVNVNAAMVRLTSGPPFLDQLEHAKRQAAAEAVNKKRLERFSPQDAQICLQTYQAALARRPDDWPIRFNLGILCHELKRDDQAIEQFNYLVGRFPQIKPFRLGLADSLLNKGEKLGALAQLEAALRLDSRDVDLQRQVDQLAQSLGKR